MEEVPDFRLCRVYVFFLNFWFRLFCTFYFELFMSYAIFLFPILEFRT